MNQGDTCLGIKVRAQDQLGIPVKVLQVRADGWVISDVLRNSSAPIYVGTDKDF